MVEALNALFWDSIILVGVGVIVFMLWTLRYEIWRALGFTIWWRSQYELPLHKRIFVPHPRARIVKTLSNPQPESALPDDACKAE